MADVDLPGQDRAIQEMSGDLRTSLANKGRSSLFFMARGVLGYDKVNEHTHGGLCEFHDRNTSQYKEVLMPRGTYKSTVWTISGSIKRLCVNPEERILIENENDGNAQRFLYAIKTHAESNKIFRTLYSDLIPPDTKKVRWNNEVLDFVRRGSYPEASITGRGITSALTSQHYTHITMDDLISIAAIKSPAVMKDTIDRAHQILSLAVDPSKSTWDLVGTRWGFADLYKDFENKYGGKMARYIRAALEFDGGLLFPEILGHEQLAQLRISYRPYLYSCLYQNNPRNEDVQDFNVKDVRFWRWDAKQENVILFDSDGQIKEIVPLDDLEISVTVDLAGAEKVVDDRNAIACCGVTPAGDVVVLDSWARRCSPLDVMEHLIELAKRYNVRIWGIEDIAYQKAFKYFLKAECDRQGLYMHVKPLKAQGKKEVRIRGLQPVLATGHLYIEPTQGILLDEMADFPLGEHDDALESLAMQLQVLPQRVGPEFWAKYKASEKELLSRLDGYGLKTLPTKRDPEEVDPEDSSYDNPPSWRDYIIDGVALG